MTRSNRFSLIFAALALLMISACQSTGGGYSGAWDYKKSASAPAQQPPKPLSGDYYKNQTAPQVQTTTLAEATASANATMGNPAVNANGSSIERVALQNGLQAQQGQPPLSRQNIAAGPVVKVAILLPLTGQHAPLGKSMLNAAQIGLFDVGHDNFELAPYDTQGSPAGAKTAAQKAVNDGAQLVLGPVFASSVRAAKSVTRSADVNMIAFSTDWKLAGGNTFIMGFLPFDQIERITSYAASQQINDIAVISPQTSYGNAVISAYRALASRYGLSTKNISSFAPQSSNLAPDIRKFTKYDKRILQARLAKGIPESDTKTKIDLLREPPPYDAVLMPVGGDLARSVSNLLSHYDLAPSTVKRLGTGLMDDMGLASENSLKGTWFAAPSPRLRKNFEQRFRSLYTYEAPRLSSLAYDATALAAILAQRGIQSQGVPMFDRGSISNPNGFAGIDGIFRFRPDGTAERGLAILEIRSGQIKIIDEAPQTFQYGFGH